MFSKIRYSIGERKLNKKAALLNRQKMVRNFSNCHHAGIIFDGSSTDDFSIVKDFMKYLSARKIESSLVGYVNADSVRDSYLLWKNCHFFCNKDLDLFYRPRTEMSAEFVRKKFDILFDLTLKDYFPLRYLTTLADADFKVGMYSEIKNDLDLMIDIRKEPSMGFLVDQIIYYVSMINNPDAASQII